MTTDTNIDECLTADQIKDYLKNNPDFFIEYPDLIELIQLPHKSGAAVSLIERQVSTLRERNQEMRERINMLLEAAKTNDKLFEKTKRLIISLLEADKLSTLVDTLSESLGTDFQVEFHSLILFGDQQALPACNTKVVGMDQANSQIGTLLRTNRPISGVLGSEELNFLFEDQAADVGSVAAVPLSHGSIFGIIAIGNSDPNYYRSSMGTLFLSYIGDALNRIVPKMLLEK
jgi:uncharacterized protein